MCIRDRLGGAHRDVAETSANIKRALIDQIERLIAMDRKELVDRRYQRLMSYGISV